MQRLEQTTKRRFSRDFLQQVDVEVPTATVILRDPKDHFLVLVGRSKKHLGEILPGGKIDRADLVGTSLKVAAERTIRREIAEEVGTIAHGLVLFTSRPRGNGDLRRVRADTLKGSLVEDAVKDFAPNARLVARYGVPDFVFLGTVSPGQVRSTDELVAVRWLDLRCEDLSLLSAGHGQLLQHYFETLRNPRRTLFEPMSKLADKRKQ